MTIVLVEGYDLYNGTGPNTGLEAKWTPVNGPSMSMTTGRFGGQCLRYPSTSSAAGTGHRRIALASPSSNFGFGVAFQISSVATMSATVANNQIVSLYDSGTSTYQLAIAVGNDGKISLIRLSGVRSGTVLATSTNPEISSNTFYFIEVYGTIHDTTGTCTVKLNGVAVAGLSGLTSLDTRNGTPTGWDAIETQRGSSAAGWNLDIDDLYVTDTNSTVGERRVETLYPTSDVAQGFARSTGSTNYTLVDEAQVNGDTDYVQGSSVGDVDTYGLGDLSSTPSSIDAVQFSAFAKKTDAGSRSIALQAKSGATTSDGSNYALASGYAKLERLLTQDPNGPTAWTPSAVNALQGGPKVTV